MTDDEILDLYSDYLISSFGQTTATGWSALLGGQISHDRIRRFLAGPTQTSVDLGLISFFSGKVPLRKKADVRLLEAVQTTHCLSQCCGTPCRRYTVLGRQETAFIP